MTQANLDQMDFTGSQGAEVAEKSSGGGDWGREVERINIKGDAASVQARTNEVYFRAISRLEPLPPEEIQRLIAEGKDLRYYMAITTLQMHYANTKPKPGYANERNQWPQKIYAVCRKDKVFAKVYGGKCLLCDQGGRASSVTFCLGVEREPVIENGTIVGMKDKTREITVRDADGNFVVEREENNRKIYAKKTIPAWSIFQQASKNFWNPFKAAVSYNTRGAASGMNLTDRDYLVMRQGEGQNDTTYTFYPALQQNPVMTIDVPIGEGGSDVTVPYDPAYEIDVPGQGRMTLAEAMWGSEMPDLRQIIADKASDRHYGYWFDPTWLPEGYDPNKPQGGNSGSVTTPMAGIQQQGYQPQQPQQQVPAPETPQVPAAQEGAAAPTPSGLDAIKARLAAG